MKNITRIILVLAVIGSCKQPDKREEGTKEQIPTTEQLKPSDEKNIEPEQIDSSTLDMSWLQPSILTADFNGDSNLDIAFVIVINKKKGIRIKQGNSNEEFVLGAETEFGNGGDDFDWVEEWNLVTTKSTYEVTFTEDGDVNSSRTILLDNPAIYIGTGEYGGATIVWKEGEYIWIHQAG